VNTSPLPGGTVTFLFSDIEGSTDLLRRVGNDRFAEVRNAHRTLLREAFDAHGGREIDTAGDGFFIVFESARSAAQAAISAQLGLASFVWPEGVEVRVRIGLHTAEPHVAEDGYVGVGVHRAARICAAARGGQILVFKNLPLKQRLFQLQVAGLHSEFGPPRTPEAEARTPGLGTFMHTDLAGSRRLIDELGDEASAALIGDYQSAVTAGVEANNGVVLERSGDHVFAVFTGASDALRAAAAVRKSVRELSKPPDWDLSIEIAIHSGRWSGDPGQPTASTAFSRLAWLAEVVEPGQVLVSQATATALEGDRTAPTLRRLGERAIPNLDEPMRVYELPD
jgi:class 3 adenylate cyclase